MVSSWRALASCAVIVAVVAPFASCGSRAVVRGEAALRPRLDPRCADRTATGKLICIIDQPSVTQHETSYPSVAFAPGDIVDVSASGCVQTGGWGNTWKRYVNPVGGGKLYHGMIRIPTAKPIGSGLVEIENLIGRRQTVTGAGMPASLLVLHLGYADDHYGDNGYYDHDDGTDDQCKGAAGVPASVMVTIYRGVSPDAPASGLPFDVMSDLLDPNGLLYNPRWSWQQRAQNQGKIPDTSMCHDFAVRETNAGLPALRLTPSFADCTDQTDPSNVDMPGGINGVVCGVGGITGGGIGGHINWFPVTMEGRVAWGDHGTDDDYTFTFFSDQEGDPLSVNHRSGLHVEFDSDETIDHFSSTPWLRLHDAVDGDDDRAAGKLFDGHTILTGMFGLDGEHALKAELHPLYALATLPGESGNPPSEQDWLMFVRNRGNEGYCSSRLWDAGFEDYTFRLPWVAGAISVDVDWGKTSFEGSDGTSPPQVAALAPPAGAAGVYVSFHLGPAASSPLIDGSLHLVWTMASGASGGRSPAAAGLPGRATPVGAQLTAEADAGEAEDRIQAAMRKLTPQQRLAIAQAGRAATTHSTVRWKPPGGPVRRLIVSPRVPHIAHVHAISAGPATAKQQRDAARMRALCAATQDAPAGLPPQVCTAQSP